MEAIDVMGLPLEEALNRLENRGIKVQIVETQPLRGPEIEGFLRVVRQETLCDCLKLTVCRVPDDYL